jgi:hypothetical protein
MRQAFYDEILEGLVGEQSHAPLDPMVEIGIAPTMKDLVYAPVDASERHAVLPSSRQLR